MISESRILIGCRDSEASEPNRVLNFKSIYFSSKLHLMSKLKYIFSFLITVVFAVAFLQSCANRAQGPTGGPKDETPPKILKSIPENGALNFRKKEIHIYFDENVTVEKVSENVIISPPQPKQPEVKGNGKQVVVQFEEDLADSTTYTINFGNAIVDLNEKNPLKDYRFSFSTGNEIDTLQISGIVLNAEDLNPVAGTVVGIHRESHDSVFATKSFLRIGKTNDEGRFVIDNVKAGKYNVFALSDLNQDYAYQEGENLAFPDSMITTSVNIEIKNDTVWKDSVTFDSIKIHIHSHFYPDNVLMRWFKESNKRQYLVKNERKTSQNFTLFFNREQKELPVIKPVNFNWDGKYVIQKNLTLDTLTYWITDSLVFANDTLEMMVSYNVSDSVAKIEMQTDTLELVFRRPKTIQKGVAVANAEQLKYKFTTNAVNEFDIFRNLTLRFDAPLAWCDTPHIILSEKVDTLFKPLKFDWRQADSTHMLYILDYKWQHGKNYHLSVDSATFLSVYQRANDKFSTQFKIKPADQYTTLKVLLAPFDSLAVIQVLDAKDKVIATKPAEVKGATFTYLAPGDYFLRVFIDKNSNWKWDTGNYRKKQQPEQVFYYSKKLNLRANWEFEETWNLSELPPLTEQKPAELRKTPAKTGQ